MSQAAATPQQQGSNNITAAAAPVQQPITRPQISQPRPSQSQPRPASQDLILDCKVHNAKTIATILSGLCLHKDSTNSTCIMSEKGIKFVVEDNKTLKTTAYLKKNMFADYRYTAPNQIVKFDVSLSAILDCINIYGNSSTDPIVFRMSYPGLENTLSLMYIICVYSSFLA